LNTWTIWLPNIVAQVAIGLGLAWILTNRRLKVKGGHGFRAVFFFPNLVTVASIAVMAYALFDWQRGPINYLLFGTGPGASDHYIWWFNDPRMSQIVVSVIQTWMWFGYTMILFVAGLQSISESYIEAALIDGATEGQIFRRILLPLLGPMMTYVLITSLIGGMQMFDLPWVLTNGAGFAPGGVDNSLTTSMVYMYSRAFSWDQNLGGASAVSWLLFLFVAVLSGLYLRFLKGRQGGLE
jgi:multiple sugar transport system permease protein